MRSPTVSCTVTVPLSGVGGSRPVDRPALAAWLRRLPSVAIAELASAIETADSDSASCRVAMTPEDADTIRRALDSLIDQATNPQRTWTREEILEAHRANHGLRVVRRAWEKDTGYDPLKRQMDVDMTERLGSGYWR